MTIDRPLEVVCAAVTETMELEHLQSGTRLTFNFLLKVNRILAVAMRGWVRDRLSWDLTRLASQLEV